LEEVVAPFEKGEEKTHCHQQHYVSMHGGGKKTLIFFLKTTMTMGWMLA
jgi:hypothetical protein